MRDGSVHFSTIGKDVTGLSAGTCTKDDCTVKEAPERYKNRMTIFDKPKHSLLDGVDPLPDILDDTQVSSNSSSESYEESESWEDSSSADESLSSSASNHSVEASVSFSNESSSGSDYESLYSDEDSSSQDDYLDLRDIVHEEEYGKLGKTL